MPLVEDKTTVLGVRMRPVLEADVRAFAAEEGETFSVAIRRLVRLGLERVREQRHGRNGTATETR